MKRVAAGALLWLAVAVMLACGGNNSSSLLVSISPSAPSVATSGTVQFSAVVQGSSDNGVFWQVGEVTGGNPSVGIISNTGLYTAPAVIPSGGTAKITAVSTADSSQKASVNVAITQGEPVTVSVSPTSATVRGGQSRQFTATVTPTSTDEVNWQVNDATGGSAENGTITSTGLYTAPTTVPTNNTVTIKAVSAWDPSKSATAQVTISPAATVTVTPSNPTMAAGETRTFTATSRGDALDVKWENPRCGSTESNGCGTITQGGAYTAPASPPPGGTITLIATPTDTTIPPGSAIVTVQYANGSFKGPYAFLVSGDKSGAVFVEAGSVVFDGNGLITGGSVDTDSAVAITGGTYEIDPDGRGEATIQVGGKTAKWRIDLTSNRHALLLREGEDLVVGGGVVLAGGTLDLQSSGFTSSAIEGKRAFLLRGASSGSATGSLGVAGSFNANASNAIGSGKLDANDSGAVTQGANLTGSYVGPDGTTGRGTITISSSFATTEKFVYYVVDATRMNAVEVNGSRRLAGVLEKQATASISVSDVIGSYAFVFAGTSGSSSPLAMGGTFSLDSTGALTSAGVDVNTSGSFQGGRSLTGTFSVADSATGRTTANFVVNGTGQSYVMYPTAGGKLNVLGLEGTQVLSGEAFSRTGGPFSNSTLKGNYVVQLSGVDRSSSPGPEQVIGVLTPNGGSAISGKLDVYVSGVTPDKDQNLNTSSYCVASSTSSCSGITSETGSMTLRTGSSLFQAATYRLYFVSPDTVLLLDSHTSRFLSGRLEKQQ